MNDPTYANPLGVGCVVLKKPTLSKLPIDVTKDSKTKPVEKEALETT
jgi:hypothetical protein